MYEELLTNGDELIKIDSYYRISIRDYIDMRKRHLPSLVAWKTVRSYVVTKHGCTIWQLSEKYLDSFENRGIGTLESPVSLIEWMISKK